VLEGVKIGRLPAKFILAPCEAISNLS